MFFIHIYIYIYVCIYIYIYVCIYIYISISISISLSLYIYIYIYILSAPLLLSAGQEVVRRPQTVGMTRQEMEPPLFAVQSYISKGIRRQGTGSFVRNSYVSTRCSVVICPYLCTSEPSCREAAAHLPPRDASLEAGSVDGFVFHHLFIFTYCVLLIRLF